MDLEKEIAELKERLARLETAPRHESHYHYHYAPQPVQPSWTPYVGDPIPQPWITWCGTDTASSPVVLNGTIMEAR